MKSFVRRVLSRVSALVAFCKAWLFSKYFAAFEAFTLKCLLFTNKQVRKLIIMKGKDPDYVPPPPAPVVAPPPDPYEELLAKRKKFTNIHLVSHPEWVTDMSKHPVLKLRGSFKAPERPTPVEQPLQVATYPEPVEIAASSVEEVLNTEDELRLFLAESEEDKQTTH